MSSYLGLDLVVVLVARIFGGIKDIFSATGFDEEVSFCHIFFGLLTSGDILDPVSVNSGTWLTMSYGGVAIYWSSILQSEIVLSTPDT